MSAASEVALQGSCLLRPILPISPGAGTQCELAQETNKSGLLLWPALMLMPYLRDTNIHIVDAPRTGEA